MLALNLDSPRLLSSVRPDPVTYRRWHSKKKCRKVRLRICIFPRSRDAIKGELGGDSTGVCLAYSNGVIVFEDGDA